MGISLEGQITPIQQVPLVSGTITVPPQYQAAFGQSRTLQMPQGFRAKVFYAGNLLSKGRFMAWRPDSVLHIANKTGGTILALPDRNRDGVADTAYIAASNLSGAHDVKFYRGAMYVALQRQVIKLTDGNSDGVYETRSVFIDNIASGATQPGGGHDTRTIIFDDRNQKVYLSIGSLCNACRETARAIIEEYDINGGNRRVYASGIRNAVGMTLHPVTNRLWANNNGNDNQGNDVPPEWIDQIRDGGFYGYPFVHSHQQWFNFNAAADYRALLPITATDSALVRRQIAPAALIQAHSAPMALSFSNASFPPQYRAGLWTVLRGSWNRTPPTGYKLIYLDFTDAQDTTANFVTDVVTGIFNGSSTWGRPVGLALDLRGNLYLGIDDGVQSILSISTQTSTDISTPSETLDFDLSPNPSSDILRLTFPKMAVYKNAQIDIFDASGKLVFTEGVFQTEKIVSIKNFAVGIYQLRLTIGTSFGIKQFVKQ